jgi:Flp pilus assembly protein protease CpaA
LQTILFDILRLTLLVIVIAYAAWSDHQTGEVKNKLWIYAPFGLSLTLINCAFNPAQLQFIILSFIATIAISFTLFYLGGWGGADAKAFLTIGAALPVTPFVEPNLMFMYPLNIILISSLLAFIVGRVRHTKTTRFLPYVFVCLFIALLLRF